MKAMILDPQVKVYNSMDDPVSIATLSKGMEVDFGGGKRNRGKIWVPVTLSTGQKGYIPGDARVLPIREGKLMQDKVEVHAEPAADSPILQTLTWNAKIVILEVIKEGDTRWRHIKDMNGTDGFIDGETRVRVIQKTKAMGRKNLLTGLMWLVAGGIITFSNSPATSGSAFKVLGLLALLFGVGTLVWGVFQLITAPA